VMAADCIILHSRLLPAWLKVPQIRASVA